MAKRTRTIGFQPTSPEQESAVEAIQSNAVTFLCGDAGTGKSYVAVGMAAKLIASGTYSRIILCRPAVEAGEKLGSLPGGYDEKIDPYHTAIMELLDEFLIEERVKGNAIKTEQVVKKAALAYMRGATLNDCVVILDEAQNTTTGQMKMVLSRLGKEAKLIITGDPKQCDLPPKSESGLADAVARLTNVEGVAIVQFTTELSNNRHPVVKEILKRYEKK